MKLEYKGLIGKTIYRDRKPKPPVTPPLTIIESYPNCRMALHHGVKHNGTAFVYRSSQQRLRYLLQTKREEILR